VNIPYIFAPYLSESFFLTVVASSEGASVKLFLSVSALRVLGGSRFLQRIKSNDKHKEIKKWLCIQTHN
jgi:hypothetical protein